MSRHDVHACGLCKKLRHPANAATRAELGRRLVHQAQAGDIRRKGGAA